MNEQEHYEYNIKLQFEEIMKQKAIIKEKDDKIAGLEAQISHLQFRIGKQIQGAWARIDSAHESNDYLSIIKDLRLQIDELNVKLLDSTNRLECLSNAHKHQQEQISTYRNVSSQDYAIKIELREENEKLKKNVQIYLHEIEKLRKQIIEVMNERDTIQHQYNRLEQDKCHACLIAYKRTVVEGDNTLIIKKTNSIAEKDMQEPNFRFLSKCPEPTESPEYKQLEEKFNHAMNNSTALNDLVIKQRSKISYLEYKLYEMNSKKSEYINKYLYLKQQIKLIIEANVLQRNLKENSQGVSYDDIKLDPDD